MALTVVDVPAPREPAVHVVGAAPPPAPTRAEPRRPGPRHARTPPGSSLVDHLLTVAALLGVVMAGVTIAAATTGLRPLVVRSGSMEPTIHTGAMVLVRTVPASAIRVGDVVAVDRPDRTRVTHRVVRVTHRGTTAELVLKGDANTDPDPAPVTVAHAGRFVMTAPWLGRVGGFLSSARGGFVLGWIVAAVMLGVLRGKRT
ncbi:MAG TPA: signal peptidase I [Mycobacteriales bacterium]|nr:signal peptidase I [Mycobacteriales bacterium]